MKPPSEPYDHLHRQTVQSQEVALHSGYGVPVWQM